MFVHIFFLYYRKVWKLKQARVFKRCWRFELGCGRVMLSRAESADNTMPYIYHVLSEKIPLFLEPYVSTCLISR